jgi:hypothetical protein
VTDTWNQAGLLEHAHGSGFVGIHHYRVLGMPIHDEAHNAVVAHRGGLMFAVSAIDGEC